MRNFSWVIVANNKVKKSLEDVRSLMKIKKRRGPKILPCGTPQDMVKRDELIPLISTNWVLLFR